MLGHRLVTLLGAGGSGKTRLAVDLARSLHEPSDWQMPDVPMPMPMQMQMQMQTQRAPRFNLIQFVPLAACDTRAQLLDALLACLQLTQRGGDPFEPLVTALAGRRVLLVLDNFETVAPAGRGRHCPAAR